MVGMFRHAPIVTPAVAGAIARATALTGAPAAWPFDGVERRPFPGRPE
jgi:hypothetical protein